MRSQGNKIKLILLNINTKYKDKHTQFNKLVFKI